jgi:predicted DNA-binding transcriptional regulator AlpA
MNALPKIDFDDYKWLYEIAPDSKLDKRDVCQLMKISDSGLRNRIVAGTFPKPTTNRGIGQYKNTAQWRVSDVIAGIKAYV